MNPAAFDTLIGNQPAKEWLTACLEAGTLPHALILEGPEGSGKRTLADRIAMTLGCEAPAEQRPCLKCNKCMKVREHIASDVTTVSPPKDRKTIGVESIREITAGLYVAPGELNVRLYIITDASLMTEQAQNALLKTLEEPPSYAYFLLLATGATALLPTVRSRAPSLRMQVFTEEELDGILPSLSDKAAGLKQTDPDGYRRMLRASGGSVGAALALLTARSGTEKLAGPITCAAESIRLWTAGSRAELDAFLCGKQMKREEVLEVAKLLRLALRDLLCVKKGKGQRPLLFYGTWEEAREQAERVTAAALLRAAEAVEQGITDLTAVSLNARLAALMLADTLSDAKTTLS